MVSLETAPSRTDNVTRSVQGWLWLLRVVTGGHSTSETCSYVFIIFPWLFVLAMFAMFVMMRVAPLVWGLPFGTGQASIAVPFSPSPDSGPSGTMSTSRASIHSLSFLKPAGLCETAGASPEYVRVRGAMCQNAPRIAGIWKEHERTMLQGST